MSSQSFADLGVSKAVAGALAARGIADPFPVQRLVIADVLAGRDVLAKSPTGSGKTLAFGIPIVDRVAGRRPAPGGADPGPHPRAREQIVDELHAVCPRPRAVDRRRLRRRRHRAPEPGRAQGAHARRDPRPPRGPDGPRRACRSRRSACSSSTRPTACSTWASARRSTGSSRHARASARRCSSRPPWTARSAGWPTLHADARRHEHAPPSAQRGDVEHRFVAVAHEAKLDALVRELRGRDRGRTLVFVRTKRGADRLVKRLARSRRPAVAMHGNKSQSQREKALARFEPARVDTLVATDVAARGLDVDGITHVINFDAARGPRGLRAPRRAAPAAPGAPASASRSCSPTRRATSRRSPRH